MKHKHFTLLLAVMLAAGTLHAQQAEKFDPGKDKRAINGYTIHLVPAVGNTFGFTVMKGKLPVTVQLNNPFSPAPAGFKNKEDAYKLAEWVINEAIKNGRPPQKIPADVGRQLNLSAGAPKQ